MTPGAGWKVLGSCTLVDATWAIVGLDPLDQALSEMRSRIDKALAGAEGTVCQPVK